jgi:DNA gyrase subunit A
LLIVTTEGYGKQTPLKDYTAKGRATGGIATIDTKALGVTGPITAARVVQQSDDLTLISSNGIVLRLKVKEVKQAGRATRGVRMMRLQQGDSGPVGARFAPAALKRAGAKVTGNGDSPPPAPQPPLL